MTPEEKESIIKVIRNGTITQRSLLYLTHRAYQEASELVPTMIDNNFVHNPEFLKYFTSADRHPEGILTEEDQTELFKLIDQSPDRQTYYDLHNVYRFAMRYKEQTERRLLKLYQDVNILLNLLAPFSLMRTFACADISVGKAKRKNMYLEKAGLNKDLTPTLSHREKVILLINTINIQTEESVRYLANLKEIAISRLPIKPVRLYANIEERLLKSQLVTLHEHLIFYLMHYIDDPAINLKQPDLIKYTVITEEIDSILNAEQ